MGIGKINIDKCLFEAEEKILEAAMADLANERFCNNALLSRYKILVHHYRKLLKLNKKIFHISDSQGQVLQRHQSEIQNLLDNANQGFLTFGRDFKVDRQYSAECTRIFGRKIGGKSIVELLEQGSIESSVNLYQILEPVFESTSGTESEFLQRMPTTFRIDGKDIRVECKLIEQSMEFIEGKLIMMILTDITDQLRAEEQIRFLSYHDKLTLLHNRAYVETLLSDLEGPQALPMSIIMLDMNGLKLVNDVFGHQQGDLLLISMAEILKKACRPSDIIARWGGDEFVVLLPQTDQEECRKVCFGDQSLYGHK
ncbi:GGDEF domain-containing protein [bacterium BFN5]|nr:GGDEF domain-containing protein [bacterium BFN5]